jgi:uncharacterized protein (TIGR04255 family)
MSLTLPPGDHSLLPGAPLELVVCQVRFDAQPGLSDGSTGVAFRTALEAATAAKVRTTQIRSEQVVLNPVPNAFGATQHQSNHGWRFTDGPDDALRWQISVFPDSLAIEAKVFTGWSEFAGILGAGLRALAAVSRPAIEIRLGLRFVNVVRLSRLGNFDSQPVSTWEQFIHPSVLGLITHPVLGQGVAASEFQSSLRINDEIMCNVRCGLMNAGEGPSTGYLIDLDIWRETGVEFEVEDILRASGSLNEGAVSIFQQVVTPNLLKKLVRNDR